jgi:hypothetical protein
MLSFSNEKFAKIVFTGLAIACCCYSFAVMLNLEFVPSVDVLYETETSLYTNPMNRAGPYFVGVAGGWFYAMHKKDSAQMSKVRSHV